MKRLASGILPPSNAYLAISLSVVLMAGAVEGRKHHGHEPPNFSHTPEWTIPRSVSPDLASTEQPELTLTITDPRWKLISAGPTITTYPLYVRLAPWLW
jgi:hypothetical protein